MADENLVTGMTITDREPREHPCEPCLEGKQTREVICKEAASRADHALSRVFSDMCGPLPTLSHKGFKYFITFVNDKTHYVSISPLKEKSEVGKHLKVFVSKAELDTGRKIKILHSDGGGEYTAGHVRDFLEECGISHEMTTADTPQHNGVAEQLNRTLLNRVRAMLSNVKLPDSYWLEALNYAILLHNVSPTATLTIIPAEAYSATKPDISRLRIFGCVAHAHVPEHSHTKLSVRSLPCTFLSFAPHCSTFRLMHRPTCKFIESHNIVFDEGGPTLHHECIILEPDDTVNDTPPVNVGTPTPIISTSVTPDAPPSSHPKRATRPPVPDDNLCYNVSSYGHRANVVHVDLLEPKTYTQAIASPNTLEWLAACEEEMCTWKDMDVYDVIPHPKGRKVIGSKWVFRVKQGPDGSILKHKARIIAQGFTQVEGIDFNQTFAPVAKFSSLCTIFALAAEHDLKVHQMDVKAAYLNADLKEEIYMEVPPGFDILEGHVLRLKKGVYGTRQGGHVWYIDFSSTLSELGYMRMEADHTVFVHKSSGFPDIITMYVDDMGLISESLEHINHDKEALRRHHQMTDLGEMGWILSIHVTRDCKKGTIALSQEKFIKETLVRYGMSEARPISTPALANKHLLKLSSPKVDTKSYQCALGSLIYPMLGTHPDLSYAIAALSRHTANPGPDHQRALERMFRYLQATSNHQLVLGHGSSGNSTLLGYTDANWASNINDRKSTSGYVFKLGSGAISWSSKKQATVMLSSTEAEYITRAHATKEAVWLRQLLSKLGQDMSSPTVLRIDNQSAITITWNPEFHDRTKHIDICYHFLRQVIDDGMVELTYTPTGEQVANALMKGLPPASHNKFKSLMGVCRLD